MRLRVRFVPAVMAVTMLAVTGCRQAPEEARVAHVGIATLMTHPALDTVVSSMKEQLTVLGYKEGESIRYTLKNANGDANLGTAIIRELELQGVDVIVAVTTPIAQAAAKEATTPIVFSAVTDPVSAGVVTSLDVPEDRITGVVDAWPYRQQLALARKIVPNAVRLGVVYNPGEAASQYGMSQIREIAPELGFEIVSINVSNTTELYGALSVQIDQVDAVYLSSDNTVIQGLPAALKIAEGASKALFVGDSGTVEQGGLAAVSVGYAGVGRSTGDLIDRVLRGEQAIPVIVAEGDEVYLNLGAAGRIGITISQELIDGATAVYRKN